MTGVPAHEIETIRQSDLFDAAWYLAQYPDVAALGMDPAEHYLWLGAQLGRKPSSRFDGEAYLAANPDIAITGINPLLHYVTIGKGEGRSDGVAVIAIGNVEPDGDNNVVSIHASAPDAALREYVDQILATNRAPGEIDTGYVPKLQEQPDFGRCPLKPIAFYLPQFHPIPENDEWWGKGFTEWTNVSKAVPQFLGHYQPHLPGELGFYDLRLVEVMRQQADLAKLYGIAGFCFHYYWFAGRRLLERPIDQYIAATDIDFPFCFCWANENWTRRWDGQEQDILMAQHHSPENDIAFIDDVIPAMRDPRYIRFDGRPVLIVYRVSLLPDAAATAARWRTRCIAAGVGDPYLVVARSFEVTDPRPFGFDAALEFPPHQIPASRVNDRVAIANPDYTGNIYDFVELAAGFAAQQTRNYPLIKTVMPSWDNEPRKPGAGHTFLGATPTAYARWLRQSASWTLQRMTEAEDHPPFIFINAWNEWAEGAHLEPDRKYGYAFLHATANVLRSFATPCSEVADMVRISQERFSKRADTALIVHLHYDDLFAEMQPYIAAASGADLFISVRADIGPQRCREILTVCPQARLSIHPNRGRDIGPFVKTLEFLKQAGYEFACKIHGKKSPQRSDGVQLRRALLNDLLGSEEAVSAILGRFAGNPQLGLVAPAGTVLDLAVPNRHHLNRHWLDQIFAEANMSGLVGTYRCNFVAGSMFWFRLSALAAMLQLDLGPDRFEDELGQVDGTLAHAIERFFAVCAERHGYVVEEVARDGAAAAPIERTA